MMDMMPLTQVLDEYVDGQEHGWTAECDWLWTNQPEQMATLVRSIAADGIREPILLGTDGRVWDGHHRIAAAVKLGLSHIPTVVAHD